MTPQILQAFFLVLAKRGFCIWVSHVLLSWFCVNVVIWRCVIVFFQNVVVWVLNILVQLNCQQVFQLRVRGVHATLFYPSVGDMISVLIVRFSIRLHYYHRRWLVGKATIILSVLWILIFFIYIFLPLQVSTRSAISFGITLNSSIVEHERSCYSSYRSHWLVLRQSPINHHRRYTSGTCTTWSHLVTPIKIFIVFSSGSAEPPPRTELGLVNVGKLPLQESTVRLKAKARLRRPIYRYELSTIEVWRTPDQQ